MQQICLSDRRKQPLQNPQQRNKGVYFSLCQQNLDPEDGYFYHSDHLGSASWISDNTGAPVQHLQYLPFGDPFVDQHASNYNERFTFTGKELDQETGFSYFGARYLDHTLTTAWLSVDPMADKYPSISPYAYCAWNPLKLVDPEGRELVLIGTADNMQKAIKMMSAKLGKNSNLSFSVDGKGRVICYGEAKTDTEKYMKGIIDNKEITVNLTVQESNVDQDGEILYGGCFDGNKFKSDTKDQIDCFQTVDLITAKENDLLVGNEWLGQTIWHEIAEAYEGGCHSIDTKIEASKAYIDEYNPEYDQAHKAASKFFPASRKPVIEPYGLGFMIYTKLVGYVFE